MSRHLGLTLLLLLAPSAAWGQEAPERLLPAGTQLYLRWDGIEPHRAAFDRTAVGQMLKGDTGKFLNGVLGDLKQGLGAVLTVPQLLEGVPPAKLKEMQADIVEAPKLLQTLEQHGLVLAVEVQRAMPPQGQVTLILPGAGADPKPFLAAMRLLTLLAKLEAKEAKVADRAVQHTTAGPVRLAWWIDGKDAVLTAGDDKVESVVARTQEKTGRLAEHPEFKKLQAFKDFETGLRGFVDGAALVKVARNHSRETAKIIDELGLDGLKAVRIYSGYDGPASRSLVEVDVPGPRRGLLRLVENKPFQLSELPPIAPDVVSFSATRLDPGAIYDVGLKAVEAVVSVVAPDQLPALQAGLKQADQVVGLNIRNDLLGQLGDLMVTYNSPAEGPFTLGQVVLFRVKNAPKLQQSIEQLTQSLAALAGAEVQVKKRDYHGVTLHEVHAKAQGFIVVPTYAIHDGWLAVALFPQPVQGFVLRKGEVPSWKPDAEVKAALSKLPTDYTTLTVSDPRPSVKQLLAIAPLIGRAVVSFAPEAKFDVGSLPNAHEATKPLFPNVSVTTDDGTTLRLRSLSSLPMPDLGGLDSYSLFLLLMLGGRF